MSEVGAFEAKTHLPKLLRRVQQGERLRMALATLDQRPGAAGRAAGVDVPAIG